MNRRTHRGAVTAGRNGPAPGGGQDLGRGGGCRGPARTWAGAGPRWKGAGGTGTQACNDRRGQREGACTPGMTWTAGHPAAPAAAARVGVRAGAQTATRRRRGMKAGGRGVNRTRQENKDSQAVEGKAGEAGRRTLIRAGPGAGERAFFSCLSGAGLYGQGHGRTPRRRAAHGRRGQVLRGQAGRRRSPGRASPRAQQHTLSGGHTIQGIRSGRTQCKPGSQGRAGIGDRGARGGCGRRRRNQPAGTTRGARERRN